MAAKFPAPLMESLFALDLDPAYLRSIREQQATFLRLCAGAEETRRQIEAAFGPMYNTLRQTQAMFGLPRLVDASTMKFIIDVEEARRRIMAPFEEFKRTMTALQPPKIEALELPRLDFQEFTLPEPVVYPDNLRPRTRKALTERIARLEERVRELEDQLSPPPAPPPVDDDPDLHTGVYL